MTKNTQTPTIVGICAGCCVRHRGFLWRQCTDTGDRHALSQRGWTRLMNRSEHLRLPRSVNRSSHDRWALGPAGRRSPSVVRVDMSQVVRVGICPEALFDQSVRGAKFNKFHVIAFIIFSALGADIADDRMEARMDVFDVVLPHYLPLNLSRVLILLRKFGFYDEE